MTWERGWGILGILSATVQLLAKGAATGGLDIEED